MGLCRLFQALWGEKKSPKASRLTTEMSLFLKWFNDQKTGQDLVLKAGIPHLWFLTLHPFEDGNGRIGRALVDLLLARAENISKRFYSLSNQIHSEKKLYYEQLEQAQKGSVNITEWLDWFLNCLTRAICNSQIILTTTLEKANFWKGVSELSLNPRQIKMINKLLDGFEGKMTSSKWASSCKTSQDTTHRDILDLIDKKILLKGEGGGRSTYYVLGDFRN